MREEYVHFIDAIPEIKEFLENLSEKDKESAYASLVREEVDEEEGDGEVEVKDEEAKTSSKKKRRRS